MGEMSIEIKDKLERYCAYQERCQDDVRRKLHGMGIRGDEAEHFIAELVSNRFISEERYARAFARGKFRFNHWGRRKIESALLSKKVSLQCIRLGMTEIKESEYRRKLRSLIGKPPLKDAADAQRRFRQLCAKGYEPDIIRDCMKDLEISSDNLP